MSKPIFIDSYGVAWELDPPSVTSDGFAVSWGVPVERNPEAEPWEQGGHEFFLGRWTPELAARWTRDA